jgi:hypothetical protein
MQVRAYQFVGEHRQYQPHIDLLSTTLARLSVPRQRSLFVGMPPRSYFYLANIVWSHKIPIQPGRPEKSGQFDKSDDGMAVGIVAEIRRSSPWRLARNAF